MMRRTFLAMLGAMPFIKDLIPKLKTQVQYAIACTSLDWQEGAFKDMRQKYSKDFNIVAHETLFQDRVVVFTMQRRDELTAKQASTAWLVQFRDNFPPRIWAE